MKPAATAAGDTVLYVGVACPNGTQVQADKCWAGNNDAADVAGQWRAEFESPRGQIYIDANTRDIVQSVYVRKVERVNGELYNVEFQEQKDVRDPPRAR